MDQWKVECGDVQDQLQKAQTSMVILEDKIATLQQVESRYILLQKDHAHLEELVSFS